MAPPNPDTLTSERPLWRRLDGCNGSNAPVRSAAGNGGNPSEAVGQSVSVQRQLAGRTRPVAGTCDRRLAADQIWKLRLDVAGVLRNGFTQSRLMPSSRNEPSKATVVNSAAWAVESVEGPSNACAAASRPCRTQ